jgi:hypothetical protein
VDRVHGAVDRGQRRSMVDRGERARWRLAGARALELTGDGGGGRAGRGGAREVLAGDEGVAERRCTGGNERRGSHRPFIGAGGAPERGGRGE